MAWVFLLIAGLFEIGFALCLKASDGFSNLLATAGFIAFAALSLASLSVALRDLPIGTAYAIWTGIGASGALIFGIILFDEPAQAPRLFFVGVIVIGVAGLQLVESR